MKAVLWVGGLTVLVSVLVHPAGRLKSADHSSVRIVQGAETPPEVRTILERACQNCHSENTVWPWYSYIAPISWAIENDVRTARRRMNLTKWDGYSADEKLEILSQLAPLVRNRIMPPPRYIVLHPEARLSAADIKLLAAWTRGQRSSLKEVSSK